jgi:hypothetical protein
MKLHSKIHAHGPELVFTDPEGYGKTQSVLVGHGASEYSEARDDAAAIVLALACHDELVAALKELRHRLSHLDLPLADAALARAEAT